MATREPVVILRIDGEDLREFVHSIQFESEANSIFSQMESTNISLRNSITMALEQLTIEHGMPPSSDSWVFSYIVEPALRTLSADRLEQPASQEIFLEEFKKLMENIILRLQEHPVIVAHSENIYDGSGIKRLLSSEFELNKLLHVVWRDLPEDGNQNTTKEQLRIAVNRIVASADLPQYGTVCQVDAIVNEVLADVNTSDENIMHEEEFKKIMTEILESLVQHLEGNNIHLVSNSVIHEPLATTSPSSSSSSTSASQSSLSMSSQGEFTY